MGKITGGVSFTSRWCAKTFGIDFSDPTTSDPVFLVKQEMELSKKIHERFPGLPLGSADPKPNLTVRYYGPWPTRLFQIVYGADKPVWDTINNCWWHSRESNPWHWVKTVEDVRNIEVPRWQHVPEIKAMFNQREVLEKAFPEEKVPLYCYSALKKDDSRSLRFVSVPSFIDVAPLMLGNTSFYRTLISEPKLAYALLEKCFEIITSYVDFMVKADQENVEGVSDLAGDYATTLSPQLYEKYGLKHDRMILEHYGSPPCIIHSCGPSVHLYEKFAELPGVVAIQTRAVIGCVKKLRDLFPKINLQLTIHPPEFDFENGTAREVKSIVRALAKEADYKNLSIRAIWTGLSDKDPEGNVKAFYQAIQKVNEA